jgi:hypothetical protein
LICSLCDLDLDLDFDPDLDFDLDRPELDPPEEELLSDFPDLESEPELSDEASNL